MRFRNERSFTVAAFAAVAEDAARAAVGAAVAAVEAAVAAVVADLRLN
jgi:hypothetical protein